MKELVFWYENLTLESLEEIDKYYAQNCYFKDPFNKLYALKDIKFLYQKMFRYLKNPKFKIVHLLREEEVASLYWEFDFVLFKRNFKIFGNSFLKLDAEDKIIEHIDYWDSVGEWWIKVPVLGFFLRLFLRN